MTRQSIGIDVGGTFTDLVAVDLELGTLRAGKVLSTPEDQSVGVQTALEPYVPEASGVSRVVHGTTVVTNMLLERRGATVALCATAGATDLLFLRRQERASLYDLAKQHEPPLVDRANIIPVHERLGAREVLLPLTDEECERVVKLVRSRDADIVAIALLHAYRDATHERALASRLRSALPEREVVCSHEVLPEIREYERTATTVCEAYARPGVARYLTRLTERLIGRGFPAPGVVASNGGLRTADEAAHHAASLALSGPAGGIAGAAVMVRAAGFRNALTIDIGGTSADVGLIVDGEPLVEAGGNVAGVPISLPRVLVDTVSAGGGSLGWIDEGGALRVGPRSAGAVPGPAAFGRGGTQPTLTDAHVVLGNVSAGRMSTEISIDAERARRAIDPLATQLSVSIERCAQAMVETADATMARALRKISVERGVDPRSCVLVAFGGGGPLHACGLAEALGMRQVLVPPFAGVLSALGLAIAPELRSGLASAMCGVDEDLTGPIQLSADRAGAVGEPRWVARMRYRGQGHELETPFDPSAGSAMLRERFVSLHQARYGFVLDEAPEVVSVRCTRVVPGPSLTLARRGTGTWESARAIDDGSAFEARVSGRQVIVLPDATLLVAPGWDARALPLGGWLLERVTA